VTGRPVAVVLSGGGAKTAAHLGAVRALVELGLRPVHYVATSMGAVIAAALASGAAPDELLARLAAAGPSALVRNGAALVAGLYARSLLRPAPFRRAVEALVPARRFTDLRVSLTVSVVDLDTAELLLFGAGGADAPLIDVLCASCALPLYFPAAILTGRRCGDGGLGGVLPLRAAVRVVAKPVVAVDVGPGFDTPAGAPPRVPAMVQAHDEAVGALMAAHTAAQLEAWRAEPSRPPLAYIRPRIERNATFQVDRVRRYADDGYQAARAHLTTISFGANSAS
jgi:NTE family protein